MQSQLRQLVLKLVRPKGMSSEERVLLTAAEAVYGINELALSTRDLPTRADNALLMSALSEPNSVTAMCAQDCLHLMSQLRPSACRCRGSSAFARNLLPLPLQMQQGAHHTSPR